MLVLGLDCGSSSIKAALLRNGRLASRIVRAGYPTKFDGIRAEVDPEQILRACADAIKQLGASAKKVDYIALDSMSPSWLAMDRRGRAITPVITHQDRRSVEVARDIEKAVGKTRHLQLAGNRPIPGGISSTTFAWFVRNESSLMKKADLVGHLNTFLHRTMTGARVTDTSNASFMGLFSTLKLNGWNDELCNAVGANPKLLPEIHDGNEIGGRLTEAAARRFGLTAGTPMMVGLVDTSAAFFLHGDSVGTLLNVSGSTDVLALCTDHPRPHEHLLTRALGVGRRWLHVATLAAAGSSLSWAQRTLFADLNEKQFYALMDKLAKKPIKSTIQFEPYLAGSRTDLEQRTAALTGLTLASTREQILSAVIEALATASAARIPLLRQTGTRMSRRVMLSGGLKALSSVLHRDWPGRWQFKHEDEATLRGLAKLEPK